MGRVSIVSQSGADTPHLVGGDGFVSLEVSPNLARDTEGTIKEALSLFSELARPNVLIKVPGTPEGVPAIEELTVGASTST